MRNFVAVRRFENAVQECHRKTGVRHRFNKHSFPPNLIFSAASPTEHASTTNTSRTDFSLPLFPGQITPRACWRATQLQDRKVLRHEGRWSKPSGNEQK